MVPVAPFREAFLRSGLTLGEVADRMDWVKPDHARVARALGLYTDRGRTQTHMTYAMARRLCDAMSLDYTDMEV